MNNTYQKTLNAYQRRTDVSSVNNDWSSDIENVLEQIRVNCVAMSKEHKNKYLFLKGILRYFRIPIILISSIASVASVGLQPYLDQPTISVITCLLSLTCGIIGSIELFLAIQSSMENELMASKDYYILSIEIFKVLTLDRENRSMDGKSFLETSYGTYVKLVENSNILDEKIADRLTLVVDKSVKYDKYIDSSSDESPTQSSPQSGSKDKYYWCNKKKANIEKMQSIDELVGHSLKKNKTLYLEQPPIHLPQIHQPPIHQPQIHQPPIHQSQMELPPPQMQLSQSKIQVSSRSSSYNNLSDLFSDNLQDPFFYNNFIKLPKLSENKSDNLPKVLSDSNLQQLSNNSSNINTDNMNNSNGSSNNDKINNSNSNDDIIGISEHNLIEYT